MTSCSPTSWSILRFQAAARPLMTGAFLCIIHERLMCFIIFIYETMFTIGESRAISRHRRHRTASTTRGWKSPIFNRNSSEERRLKFIASGEDDEDKKPRNLVPRVLSYPPPWSERERDPGKRWSRGSRTKLFLREESFVSHVFVWSIRDVHAVIATAR